VVVVVVGGKVLKVCVRSGLDGTNFYGKFLKIFIKNFFEKIYYFTI